MSVRESKALPSCSGSGWRKMKGSRRETKLGQALAAFPWPRLYHVFNMQQCELPERLQPLLKSAEPQSPAPSHRFLLVKCAAACSICSMHDFQWMRGNSEGAVRLDVPRQGDDGSWGDE